MQNEFCIIRKFAYIWRYIQVVANFEKMFPNKDTNTGILSGLLIDNSFGPYSNDFIKLIELPLEELFVWTPEKDNYSKLISVIKPSIHNHNYWKNFGILFKYVMALTSDFESLIDLEYKWITDFDKTKLKEDLIYPELEKYRFDEFTFNYDLKKIYNEGRILNLSYFFENKRLLSELYFNDKFFFAVQHIVSAVSTHWYCHVCELSPPEYRKHPNHDFEKYYEVFALPRLEIAIIQATKAVEGLLGQPGSNKEKRLARWKEVLNIEPDEKFLDTNKSYFNFHAYLVNEIRNKVAHNLKSKPFKANRKLTIQAQIYAWKLVNDYYGKVIKSDSIKDKLIMNTELESMIRPNLGTKLTAENKLATTLYKNNSGLKDKTGVSK